jgi:xanthine phosphoribosyltransferase
MFESLIYFTGKDGIAEKIAGYFSMQKKHIQITWEQFESDCQTLARVLQSKKAHWAKIIAVTRGGLIPAGIIAKVIGVRVIDTICIASYDGQTRGEVTILKGSGSREKDMLIVDDLVDTGETARMIRQLFPNAHVATVYVKPPGRHLVDSFALTIESDAWIVFPWDKKSD